MFQLMLSVHVDIVFSAFSSPLPPAPQLPHVLVEPMVTSPATDDELSQASLAAQNVSISMLMSTYTFRKGGFVGSL